MRARSGAVREADRAVGAQLMAKYLLIVRAGDRSLHPGWLNGARAWDLHISYFGAQEKPFGDLPPGVTLSREKGPKYIGLKDCLEARGDFLRDYTHIGLPDDDLACDAGIWNRTFGILDEIGADLGQPSLLWRSFYSYDITMRRRWLKYRITDFVEVMAPIFKVAFLREALPTFAVNRSSWGLDYVWREIAKRKDCKLAIVDAASLLHTRALGKGGQYSAANMGGSTQLGEYQTLLDTYRITDTSRRALYGVRPSGAIVRNTFALNRRLLLPRLYREWKTTNKIEAVS
jgi:hypothetical protein